MSDSDCDWYDKSDEKLLGDLRNTIKRNVENNQMECIRGPSSREQFLKQLPLVDNSLNQNLHKKQCINIHTLRELSVQNNLDIFLFALTFSTTDGFFYNQITANDNNERVQLYVHILAAICELELPGFHKNVLQKFSENELLLNQLECIMSKAYSKYFPEMWEDINQMECFIKSVQLLLRESYNIGVLSQKGIELIQFLVRLIQNSDNHSAQQSVASANLKEDLNLILSTKKLNDYRNIEIYPNIEELTKQIVVQSKEVVIECRKTNYIVQNLRFLKEHFLHPLRNCVQLLKSNGDLNKYPDKCLLLENVYIIFNEKYSNAQRCEFTFVDAFSEFRSLATRNHELPALREKLLKLKSGALLCFSTSKQFENIIYAIVTFTNPECLNEGYIGIEVVQQLNIGNIYNCPLLMFEAPLFFEPYNNVYNYLRNCNITNFPMEKYIIHHEINEPCPPSYLTSNIMYTHKDEPYIPLTDIPPNASYDLKLDDYQLHVYCTALKNEFSLIQGPPGTGKTHLSLQLLKCLIENVPASLKPIVLIAYTNDALDKLLLKLSTHTERMVRLGSQSRSTELSKFNITDIPDHGQVDVKLKKLYSQINDEYKMKFKELVNQSKVYDGSKDSYTKTLQLQRDLNNIQEKLRTIKTIFQYYMVRDMDIIGMTTTYAAKVNFLFKLLKSSIVMFEEAAEILECHVVACLTPYSKHIIMIGDHKQLKPFTCNSPINYNHEMNISLFEKLFHLQQKPLVLKKQYRMHPRFTELLVPHIYKELNNDVSVWEYEPIRKMLTNLYFLQHKYPECKLDDECSMYNPYEVKQILTLTQHLIINAGYSPNDIVVLSPYVKQVDFIKKQFIKNLDLNTVKVCTVDSFQGLEANIIILSLVRCNTINQIGFLKESNRICVALSRAKWAQYMIGDLDLLSKCSILWCKIKEKLEHHKAVGKKFPMITN